MDISPGNGIIVLALVAGPVINIPVWLLAVAPTLLVLFPASALGLQGLGWGTTPGGRRTALILSLLAWGIAALEAAMILSLTLFPVLRIQFDLGIPASYSLIAWASGWVLINFVIMLVIDLVWFRVFKPGPTSSNRAMALVIATLQTLITNIPLLGLALFSIITDH